ncbi:MAG TPA: redoxin domain-containing protein [Longimicrobiaceae bacterium]|jgi:peroxiredoxin|nr:redoxin domain-containing protein [Longimicrobiaceae bacterium]
MAESRRQWIIVGAIVLVLAALIGAGWTMRGRFVPVDVGSPAPDFAVRDMQGRQVKLSDLRGQVVLLNVWATWCGPCREEMPSMQRLYTKLAPEGLHVVAVSIDATGASAGSAEHPGGDVGAFVRQFGLTFPVWLDPEGETSRLYRTTGVPESFVIDRDGSIVKKVIGATEWDTPDKVDLVRRLLKE